MKNKFMALGVLMVSAVMFASEPVETVDVLSQIDNLNAEFDALEAREEETYEEAKANAEAAKADIAKNDALKVEIQNKIKAIDTARKGSELSEEYKAMKVSYNNLIKDLDAENKENNKVIKDFEKLEAIKNPKAKAEKTKSERQLKKEKAAKIKQEIKFVPKVRRAHVY